MSQDGFVGGGREDKERKEAQAQGGVGREAGFLLERAAGLEREWFKDFRNLSSGWV